MTLNSWSMICVAVSRKSQLAVAVGSGCSMLELRLDLIGKEPAELFRHIPGDLQVVATYRPGVVEEERRLEALKECMELGASYVDVEMESRGGFLEQVKTHALQKGCGLIISYHNFDLTPPAGRLTEILEKCYSLGADIAKIATMVHTGQDAVRLLSLYGQPGRKVVLGMGEGGRITRVAAPYLGSEFTFASVEGSGGTAPGQMTVAELKHIYGMIDGS